MAARDRPPGAPLTTGQAAAMLGLSAESIRRMVKARQLPAYRDGPRGGRLLIPERAVLARLASKARAAEARVMSLPPVEDMYRPRVRRRRPPP